MAKEESTIGGTGTLLGTASLQHALDTLSKNVQSLTTAYQQGRSGGGFGASAKSAAGWISKDWNSNSNKPTVANGGGSAPPPPQRRGKAYTDELLGGGSGGRSGGTEGSQKGNGGHSLTRSVAGAVGYVAASGIAQMDNRVLMNTATSMLNRTAVNGSGARSMFQNNFTSMGVADTISAQNTVQRMGYAVGTSGYNTATNYNRTAGLIDPTLSQASAAGAMAQMQTGNTFNTLRMFGISTIGKGGTPTSPRDLAHQFITKSFGANKPTSAAGIEASLGQKSRFGQSLDSMVSRGMLDENTASQVTTMMRAELNAGLKGKSYDQYTSILDKYGSQNSTSAAGTKALASIGLTPTDAAKIKAQQAMKTTQLDANNDAFSTGLGAATTLLGQFSNALTAILKGPLGSGLGVSQGFMGGLGATVGNIGAGASAMGGMFLAKAGGKALLTSTGRASAMAGMKSAPGAVTSVAGKAVGSAVGLAKYAKFLKFSPLIGIGAGGLQPNPYTVNPDGTLSRRPAGAPGGQDGGAAAGQDRASGAAAKATGTVGAGKTASNVVAIAKKYLGIPYHYGGTTPQQGFDCSGLTQYVFAQVGISLPRVSQAQQTAGKPVNKKDAQPGDLVFFGGNAKSGGAHHVAMLVSSSQIIEAAHTGTNVRIRSVSMNEISTVGRFLGSMGSMSTDAVANTDGASSKTGSGSSAGSSFAASFFGNALNEMDVLGGTLGSFLGAAAPSGKRSSASRAVGAEGGTSNSGGVSLAGGGGNPQKVFNTLVGMGFTAQAAAGVIGNLMQESGVNPNSHQGGGGPGRGIMQWTVNARWATLQKWAGKRDPWALDTQVGFMMKEMNDAGVTGKLKGMTSVDQAVKYFHDTMERSADKTMTARNGFANSALSQYGGKKSYAVGSTNIDVDQDARVHQGEMILPTQQAEAVRQALAGNSPMSAVTGLGGKGVQITFGKESIKIILGTGVTSAMGTRVGRQIVDTIVNDKRLSDIAKGVS